MPESPGISFEDLLRYEEEQTEQWRQLFTKKPYLLKVDATPTSTVAELLFHTFAAEYRSAQRLLGEEMTPDTQFAQRTVSDLFSIGDAARLKFREYLSQTSQQEIAEPKTFPSHTLGQFQASPKKLLAHAIVHSIRHWAQIARVLRENGQRADFSHDLLFSKKID
ncbi:MAG TPA: DinB family protein [Terriglobales bacterium]|nr:DinB family protein [Terriglobales bacterium]